MEPRKVSEMSDSAIWAALDVDALMKENAEEQSAKFDEDCDAAEHRLTTEKPSMTKKQAVDILIAETQRKKMRDALEK